MKQLDLSFRLFQLVQAAEGKFNPHIHVEYEWSLRLEEMDESDDDLDDKVMTQAGLFSGSFMV